MDHIYIEAGIRIRALRDLNNYTKAQLAEKIGITQRYLYNIETGRQGFTADTLLRISEALHVSCDYILNGEDEGLKNKEVMEIINKFDKSQMPTLVKVLNGIYEMWVD